MEGHQSGRYGRNLNGLAPTSELSPMVTLLVWDQAVVFPINPTPSNRICAKMTLVTSAGVATICPIILPFFCYKEKLTAFKKNLDWLRPPLCL
jgi:hypothetical protein